MATINAVYESKQHDGNIKKRTGFAVAPAVLDPYSVPNVREGLDKEHIAYLESCYLKGEYVEPIVVLAEANDKGLLRVLEGRHRTHAALQAVKKKPELVVEVRAVPLTEAVQHYGFMLKSDRRLPFSFLEKSNGVYAMKQANPKLTAQQLADVLDCTKTAVENYLILGAAPEDVKEFVRAGSISGSQAVEYVRDHGDKAAEAIKADLERVARVGQKKVPGAGGKKGSKFSHSKALDALEILLNLDYDVKQLAKDKGEVALKLGIQDAKDLIAIIDEYQLHVDEGGA